MVVTVQWDERYWYPEDGGVIWLAGYSVVDPATGAFFARDAPQLAAAGLRISGVAGAARHHADALEADAAAPGRALVLRREPDNAHDSDAIAVATDDGALLGYVPRTLAAELAPELDASRPWAAIVLRELRASPRDPRTGVTMLLAAAPMIELRER